MHDSDSDRLTAVTGNHVRFELGSMLMSSPQFLLLLNGEKELRLYVLLLNDLYPPLFFVFKILKLRVLFIISCSFGALF